MGRSTTFFVSPIDGCRRARTLQAIEIEDAALKEAAEWTEDARMNDMMGSGMMWGMGLVGFIGIVVAVLVIAALVKYLFFR